MPCAKWKWHRPMTSKLWSVSCVFRARLCCTNKQTYTNMVLWCDTVYTVSHQQRLTEKRFRHCILKIVRIGSIVTSPIITKNESSNAAEKTSFGIFGKVIFWAHHHSRRGSDAAVHFAHSQFFASPAAHQLQKSAETWNSDDWNIRIRKPCIRCKCKGYLTSIMKLVFVWTFIMSFAKHNLLMSPSLAKQHEQRAATLKVHFTTYWARCKSRISAHFSQIKQPERSTFRVP